MSFYDMDEIEREIDNLDEQIDSAELTLANIEIEYGEDSDVYAELAGAIEDMRSDKGRLADELASAWREENEALVRASRRW